MTQTEKSPTRIIDIKDLAFDRGAHLLINRGLADTAVGERLGIRGRAPELAIHMRGWCRAQGHDIVWPETVAEPESAAVGSGSPFICWIVRGNAGTGRWRGAQRAGLADPNRQGAIVALPPGRWGLAARGATVEAGAP